MNRAGNCGDSVRSFAYDTGKAAANHLVRELAVAYGPLVRVNGVAPATIDVPRYERARMSLNAAAIRIDS